MAVNSVPTATDHPLHFNQRDAKVIETATLATGNIQNKTLDSTNTLTGVAITASNSALTTPTVTTPTINSEVVSSASGSLTAAQVIAATSAHDLIAAPGSGKVNIIESIELFLDYAAAFTSGSDVKVIYSAGGDIVDVVDSFFTGTADDKVYIKPTIYDLDNSTGTGKGFDADAAANAKVQLKVTGTAFADGTGTVLKWRINYKTVTLLT